MKIVSTNLAKPKAIKWRGKQLQTGIYKNPVDTPMYLQKEDVANDTVVDRKNHGGEYKACYLFGADYYEYWKEKYPNMSWNWGMFGENLTVEGLDENNLFVGDVYQIGSATVQITEPRQPCFKLGVKFNDQRILQMFIDHEHPGTYVRILNEGNVAKGDELQLSQSHPTKLSVNDYFRIVMGKSRDAELLKRAIANECIRESKKEWLKKRLGN